MTLQRPFGPVAASSGLAANTNFGLSSRFATTSPWRKGPIVLALLAGLACGGCATASDPAATPRSSPVSSTPSGAATGFLATTPTGSATSGSGPTPSGTVSRPADPVAPADPSPVQRAGVVPTPTISARSGGFTTTTPVAYLDGVELVVTAVKHSVESGQGPGMFPGRALTELSLTLTNTSAKPIDVNQVVVTTTYGSPARTASPVYNDPAAKDFAGFVAPKSSATSTYVFSIPTADLHKVTTVVDFDGIHVASRFMGSAL